MEDVHRAGGIPAILGELRRGGLLNEDVAHRPRAHDGRVARRRGTSAAARATDEAVELFHAAPGCVRSATAFSQSERWESLDIDAAEGCIRDVEHAYTADGGLAILYGNLAERRLRREDRRRRRVDPDASAARPSSSSPRTRRSTLILGGGVSAGRRGRHPLRGPARRPGHAGDALPDLLPQGPRARQGSAR